MARVNPPVYLTGFMGSGKSAVGKALARLLRRPFVDLDACVERETGLRVAEVFARRGEAAFRRLERRALLRAAKKSGAVVALGGGALLDRRNRAVVEKGILIKLECSRRELVRRLGPARSDRPLLSGGPLSEKIKKLLDARRGAYGMVDFRVSTTSNPPRMAARLIARRLA